MDLSIIILNWNAADDTIQCVKNITAWQRLQPNVWVVDNASQDDSVRRIAENCPTATILSNDENLGFAGGNNRALKEILHAGDTPILLLNNDAIVTETTIETLLHTLRTHPQAGFAGPLLFDTAHPDRLLSAGGQNPVTHYQSHTPKRPDTDTPFAVDYVPGTVLLASAAVFRQVGLLDEQYFFSMEVADLCHRAGKAGFQSFIVPTATAQHSIHRSGALRKSLYPYYVIRNRFLFLRRHYPHNTALFAFWVAYSIALAAKTALAGKRATARAVWLGLGDGLRGRFGNRNAQFLGDA